MWRPDSARDPLSVGRQGGEPGGLTPSGAAGTPTPGHVSKRFVPFRFLVLLALVGCGDRITAEDQEFSMRQVDLAASLRQEGNIPSALEHLRIALDRDPENVEAYLLLAYIQAARSDFGTAEGNARRGVELMVAQQRGGSRLAEARNLLGGILMNLGRFDEAVVYFQESALDAYNQTPHLAWYNLALAQSAGHHDEAALQSLTEAIRLRPTFCDGYYGIGQILFQEERFEQADSALTQAVTVDPQCGDSAALQGAWSLRGQVRLRLGRRDDAISDLERCIELGPNTEDGRRCQAVLDGHP